MRHWKKGDSLTHRFNRDLGIGRVTAVHGRTLVVEFAQSNTTLRLAANNDALVPVDPDSRIDADRTLLDRLASGDVDDARDLIIRLDMLHLLALREAGGLGSFLGGRIRLFPHQLYVAERASRSDPVRWLLADEVGLGKTIEAALILNRLVHARRVERCLVVAPAALTVQWLGELWRKYHQVFTLLDTARLADVARDFGSHFNPFDVHRRVVIALETLIARPDLTTQAVAAGIDLLVVDEAQRLRRPKGHPGDPAWRAIAPIAALGRHVLLLSATPLEDDAHGFFRLLQLLRPEEFPEDMALETRLSLDSPLPPCTSATRRVDIGGLPPRVGMPIDLDGQADRLRAAIETEIRSIAAADAIAKRRTIDRLRRALASGAALRAVLTADERDLRARAERMDASDPRLDWLLSQARQWKDAGEKTLVFVAHRETLEMLRTALSNRGQLLSGVFHEDLSPARCDTEVALFRDLSGPSILISTESGGQGRNFEFCRRLVLFDLPWTPSVIEQRIGRLDRIGRRLPVDIVYFRPADGIGRDVVRLFEGLGLFREPMAGVEPQLAHIEPALEEIALDPLGVLSRDRLDMLLAAARGARARIREAAYQQLHREPYHAAMAAGMLSRVPSDLDALNEHVVVAVCARLGFHVEHTRGRRTFAIEFGNEALVDSLPGVPGGSTFVGTFDREEAVDDETLDYFATGHSLVEGLFAYVDESPLGRVARVQVQGAERGTGLIAIYRTETGFDVVAIDATGRHREDWAMALRQRSVRVRALAPDAAANRGWPAIIRRLGARLSPTRRPYALAAVVVTP